MFEKSVEEKHSKTALIAALYRTIAHKEISSEQGPADSLAEYFLPFFIRFLIGFKMIRARGIKKSDNRTPGLYEYMIARTSFFDAVFKDEIQKNIPQIVLLGAGYDTRAYRFKHLLYSTKIFELDIATTQNRKKRCLEKAKIEIPGNVTFVPIDFNKESVRNALENAGYDPQKKTLFLWEGVSYYLENEAVDATFDFFRLFSHTKSMLVFDYAVPHTKESMENDYGVKAFVDVWKKHRTKEPFKFFIDEQQIHSFLEQRGLTLKRHLDSKEMEKEYVTGKNDKLSGRVIGLFRLAVVSITP